MNKIHYNILALMTFILLSACNSIHEFPTPEIDQTIEVEVSLKFNVKNLRDMNSGDGGISFSAPSDKIRVVMSLYKQNDPYYEVERRVVFLDQTELNTIQLKEQFHLEINKYSFLLWVDYVDNLVRSDQFYITSDLHSVYFKEPLISNTDNKDCLSGMVDVDLTPYRHQTNVFVERNVNIKRHVAKYALIANDLEKFVALFKGRTKSDIDFFTAKVMYATYMPNSYNVYTGQPNDSKPGLWYESKLYPLPNGEVLICFDYPLVAQKSTTVQLQIFDQNGKMINEVGDIRIPIARDSLTIIRSDFLSRQYSPGISIHPDYDGSYDIDLPD